MKLSALEREADAYNTGMARYRMGYLFICVLCVGGMLDVRFGFGACCVGGLCADVCAGPFLVWAPRIVIGSVHVFV